MNKSKFTYPKCPYCKAEYQEHCGDMNYNLLELATRGYKKEAEVKCNKCGKIFRVRVHITYYGSKIS